MPHDQNLAALFAPAEWLAHRYDPSQDHVHFLNVSREQHQAATFLTDEYLPQGLAQIIVPRGEVAESMLAAAPVHFIFHSAFCLSTLLARAFDVPGTSMALKEPVILNDLVGWRLRGGTRSRLTDVLDTVLTLLARPFQPRETMIIKPSNIVNGLADAMMTLRPAARALFIHAPLTIFLKSVAKKGLDGRVWIRDLYVKQLKEGLIQFHFEQDQYLALTDLQVAGVCWLAQHALFARLAADFGSSRIRVMESEQLLAQPQYALTQLADYFDIALDPHDIAAIIKGPAFTHHSKSHTAFDAAARARDYDATTQIYGDEIQKVALWVAAVAENAGVPLTWPRTYALLD